VLGIKNPSVPEIQALLRQYLLSVPGVVAVQATASFNRSQRAFAYNFQATFYTNVLITGGSGQAFQITGGP
jgi:hypothetical protein